MAEFKTVIADPKNKMAYQKVLSEEKSNALVGKSVGEEIDGILLVEQMDLESQCVET